MTNRKVQTHYGIDAPGLVKVFFGVGFGSLLLLSVVFFVSSSSTSSLLIFKGLIGLVATYCLTMGSFMTIYSRFIKVKDREKLLDLVDWKGNEMVLDVGCGRGLLLVGAAKRLTSGKSIGIDLWLQKDQSNNNAEGALLNASLEDVKDRVEVKTADMREIPFPSESFDVVTSAWAVHNLEAKVERKKVLDEILRVLKPKGVLILADISNQDEYEEYFRALGWHDMKRENYVSGLWLLKRVSFGSFAPSATVLRKQ